MKRKAKQKRISARRVVATSLAVDVTDVLLNFAMAVLSGSVVVLTEALQGLADMMTSVLLWVGVHQSRRKPNKRHQFGYGKELFFWILMAGLSMLVLTAGFSLYFGLQRLMHPEPVRHLAFTYLVLSIGFVTNAYALSLSIRRLELRRKGGLKAWWRKIRASTFIETKATLILDAMGSVASVLGLVSLVIYGITGDARLDGLGAIVVGLSCAVFATLLILEVKGFIVGRSATPEMEHRIKSVAERVSGVHKVLDLRTMQMGSEKVMVNMEVHIDHRLRTEDIERLMDDLKAAVKVDVPEVQHIQVEVETPPSRAKAGENV